MKLEHIDILCCPATGSRLMLKDEVVSNGRIKSGMLCAEKGEGRYPIVDFIPRFVPQDNYAANFGLEWNTHARTQYDDENHHKCSKDRFVNETKWPENLQGELMLEAGSGSGRLTCHAAETGALVVSFDYSNAVEANYNSNGHLDNILIIQASIFDMPFAEDLFDRVFCFGVLQHTPEPRKAFSALVSKLKHGGTLAADNYIKDIGKYWLQPKYWVRPWTKNRNPERLYDAVKRYVDFMWPLTRMIRKIPGVGPIINWKLLVADYSREYPGADEQLLKDLAYLDTYDMLSPAYDYPVTVKEFRQWFESEDLEQIDVHQGYGGVEGRGLKLCPSS